MLVGKARSVRYRVATILLATLGITAAGVLITGLGAVVGAWSWPPQPGSPFGISCGLVGGSIILFEMALLPRKWLRGQRLGAMIVWMRWHIWLGIACLPIILIHTGFRLGGPLTTVTQVLFLVVIASGVWGFVMQQWLPQKILADVPGETVCSQVDFTGEHHAHEAARLVAKLVGDEGCPPRAAQEVPHRTGRKGPVVVRQPAEELCAFSTNVLLPYLRHGQRSRSPLSSRAEVERWFARFRDAVPTHAHPELDRLEKLCDLRRQWDLHRRLDFWLHNWLLVHLPFSVAMTGLMILHAIRALKYW